MTSEREALVPWAFDADTNTIEFTGCPVFTVFRESDFPCIEDDERAQADMEYLAHAQSAVMLLNMVATTKEPTLDDAFRKLVAALSHPTPTDGLVEARTQLANLIESRLLGIDPDDQDVVLEDSDWRIILAALRPSIEAQPVGEPVAWMYIIRGKVCLQQEKMPAPLAHWCETPLYTRPTQEETQHVG